MVANARSEIVRRGEVGVYHCWARCVRRAFLCGMDPLTGQNFEHRREWLHQLQGQLAGLFGIRAWQTLNLFVRVDRHQTNRTRRVEVRSLSGGEILAI